MSARSSGIAAGGWPLSLAKLVTAERRSRLRVSERPAYRQPIEHGLQGRRGGGLWRGIGLHWWLPGTPEVRGGPGRTGGDIRELSYSTDGISP